MGSARGVSPAAKIRKTIDKKGTPTKVKLGVRNFSLNKQIVIGKNDLIPTNPPKQ
jgi:hypothetical protein